jgi:type II secretory pathway component PulF
MVLVGSGVVFFMITFVIPQVRTIFEETGRALPLPTQILLSITGFISSWWWAMLIVMAGLVYGFGRYIRTEKGRKQYDQYMLKMPIFGNLTLLIALSRFTERSAGNACNSRLFQ